MLPVKEQSIIGYFDSLSEGWLRNQVCGMMEELEGKPVVQKAFGRECIQYSFAISRDKKLLQQPHIQVYEMPSQVFWDNEFKVYWRSTGSWD